MYVYNAALWNLNGFCIVSCRLLTMTDDVIQYYSHSQPNDYISAYDKIILSKLLCWCCEPNRRHAATG
jgi:hypothetical protein